MKTFITPAYETLDDIVFANRNRLYGAYDLRQVYPKTLRNALLLGIGLFLLMFILPTIYGKLKLTEDSSFAKEITLEKVIFEKKEQKPLLELEKPKEVPKLATIRYRVPEVIENPPHEVPPPIVEEFTKANPGQETMEGAGTEDVMIVAPPEDMPLSKAVQPTEVEIKDANVFVFVESQPEFIGGMTALRDFLSKNLRYPSTAQRSNVQGKVFLSFTVETDGSLSNINVIRGIGFGCDEEALRVMQLMPKWKPGKQSGRAVRVKFNIPIAFTLE